MSGDEASDGRKARGAKRRAEIIAAALAVVQRDGAGGVTHRAVAKEAGIPTSLSAYYFATIDDLLVAALATVADSYTAKIRAIIDRREDVLRGLAELIAESAGGPGRDRALAERELSTLASRRPALRPVARRWRENVAELGGRCTDDPEAISALVAVSDGMCTALLIENAPADVDHIYAVLRKTLNV
ncbi:TetR/AcrR family transcriptional regulator [Salininema proteolyticum]|uniref:TetR/AcrR family transcriptional regulator n=1 Tax=Salininema proteolyticum TaxID=1607685 RepID=A0ABV8TWW8_9ACTN